MTDANQSALINVLSIAVGTIVIVVKGHMDAIKNNKAIEFGNDKTDATAEKVDGMHGMLNSQLTKYKEEMYRNYQDRLNQALEVVRLQNEKSLAEIKAEVKTLKDQLIMERDKAVALALSVSSPQTPEDHLNRIREGQQP